MSEKNNLAFNTVTGNFWGGASVGFNATRAAAVAVDSAELAVLRHTFLNVGTESAKSEDVVTPVLVGYAVARFPQASHVTDARFCSILRNTLRRHGWPTTESAVSKLTDAVVASGKVVKELGRRGARCYRLPAVPSKNMNGMAVLA